ncbi:MAG: hypothetical protein KDI06_10270 [Calditrichaeota bacterium]|nr:hypothetical protein [Calditrichota bacterium]HQU73565.1 hypothetical protein [Calditrichia bacterium]
MKTFLAIAMILCLSSGAAFSDTYFSSQTNGLGTRQFLSSVRAMGMGGGFAFGDSLSLENYLISQWRYVDHTRATFVMGYNRNDTELPGTSFTVSTAEFNGLSIAIPIQRQKWVIGATLQPYLLKESRLEQQFINPNDSSRYTQRNDYTGNVNLARFNLVWSPMPQVGLALHGNFYFGTLEESYTVLFNASSYLDIGHAVQYRVKGAGIGLSADVRPVDNAHLAAFVDLKPKLSVDVEYLSSLTYLETGNRNINSFPLHYGLAGGFQFAKQWQAVGGYAYQDWASVLKQPATNYDSWSHFNVGLEHQAAHIRRPNFLERFDWRAGYSQTNLGYLFNNASVTEKALHFGVGMPFSSWYNRLDLALVVGMRGDLTDNQVEEKFINLNFSLSMGELWFQRIR